MLGARKSLARLAHRASTAVTALARHVSATKNVKDDLSNDIVRYRGLSVAALQEIWDDVLGEKLAQGTQLYVLTQEAVAEDEHGNEVGHAKAGTTAAVRRKQGPDGWLEGQVAYVQGTVRFRPEDAEFKAREDWTIEDVCEHVVLAETIRDQCFYLDVLLEEDEALVGKPFEGAFVSQARACSFGDLVAAIVGFYSEQGRDLRRTFVWLDLFSANQPKLTVKDPSIAQEVWQKRYDLLTYGLHTAIERFDERLIFFDKWDDPAPLTRMWCVWEVYGAVMCGRALEPIFVPGEDERFIGLLMQDRTLEAISKTLTNFDMVNAKCHSESDAEMIATAVSGLEGGFRALNGVVLKQLRGWLAETAQRVVEFRLANEGRSVGVADLMHRVGQLLQEQGLYGLALRMLNDSLAIKRTELGPREVSTAGTMGAIAQTLFITGQDDAALELFGEEQYDAAQMFFEEALDIKEEHLGPKHPSMAATMAGLAQVLQLKGQYGAALERFEEALEMQKEQLGPKHPKVATLMACIAQVLQRVGYRNGEALAQFEEALEILKEQLGPRHPETAGVMYGIGQVQRAIGRFDAALAQFEEALDIFREKLGPKNIMVANTMYEIGIVLQQQEQYDKALAQFEEVLEARKELLGPKHHEVTSTMYQIGTVLEALEQYDAAQAQFEEVLKIRKEQLGPKHLLVASAMKGVAYMLKHKGQSDEALALLQEVRAIQLEQLGPFHPEVKATNSVLTELALAKGDIRAIFAGLERAFQ